MTQVLGNANDEERSDRERQYVETRAAAEAEKRSGKTFSKHDIEKEGHAR